VKDVLPSRIQLIAGEFTAPLEIYLIASVMLGVAASTPVIAYEAYRNVDSALFPEEPRPIHHLQARHDEAIYLTTNPIKLNGRMRFKLFGAIP
jgi:hypothetical protein